MEKKMLTPNGNDLFELLGNILGTILGAIFELFDNSVSAGAKNIYITLKHRKDNTIDFSIEDDGSGVANPAAAFTVANKTQRNSVLNHFGLGLKAALAKMALHAAEWIFQTKNKLGNAIEFCGPYPENFEGVFKPVTHWLGHHGTTTGTFIGIHMSYENFNSLHKKASRFDTIADMLYEHIGFRYASKIDEGLHVSMTLIDENKNITTSYVVTALSPTLVPLHDKDDKIVAKKNLCIPGSDNLKVDIKAYELKGMPERKPFDNTTSRLYYKRNQKSQGAQIRINGVILVDNLVTQIWPEKCIHNKLNPLLIQIDLLNATPENLPNTTAIKNNFDYCDEVWDNIFAAVRMTMENVSLKEEYISLEEAAKKELCAYLSDKEGVLSITQELPTNICEEISESKAECVDIAVSCTANAAKTLFGFRAPSNKYAHVFIEGKSKTAISNDVMQAVKYCAQSMGHDNVNDSQYAILVAPSFEAGTQDTANILNDLKLTLAEKRVYVKLMTWDEFGISIEKIKHILKVGTEE